MMRRPQRTKDRLRAGGEDGAYLCGSLEGLGELNQWPRAQPSGSRSRLKREHGAYLFFRSRRTARELAAARGVRRSNARRVRAAPAGRCTKFHGGIASSNSLRPTGPGRI